MIKYLKKGKSVEAKAEINAQVRTTVENIIADIEQRGEQAVREYSEKFDKWNPASLRMSQEEIQACIDSLSPQALEDIKFAQTQIRRFAEAQLASLHDVEVETLPGVIGSHERSDREGGRREARDRLRAAVQRQAVAGDRRRNGAGRRR
jgi:sulfopropanediol 3-dehydrogenase